MFGVRGTMEGVNRNTRQRGYEARDKEEILKKAKDLHKEGYSQVFSSLMI